jgi:tRNA pseudouridine55 synthase
MPAVAVAPTNDMRSGAVTVHGLAVVDKPAGMTSHDVVNRCRRTFGQKKVGHAGTLDPDATGVLLVGLGGVTRLLQFMSGLEKSYRAEVVLGVATTTLDASGDPTGCWDQSGVTLEQVRREARRFTGTIEQVPPMVSAVKVGGRRLHELARAGVEVERAPREVTVSRFEVESLRAGSQVGGPVLSVCIDCSSGTYVRVLAADLGAALGGGAHVAELRRWAVGPWTESDAVPLAALTESAVISPADALPWLLAVVADAELEADVAHGRVLDASRMGKHSAGGTEAGPWRVLSPAGHLLAVYQAYGRDRVKPAVVMAAVSPSG